MSSSPVLAAHPVVECLERVGELVESVGGQQTTYLTTREKAAALVALERDVARLQALQLRILAEADDLAGETGARSAGAWLGHEVQLGYAEAGRRQRLAEALELSWPHVAAALGAGRMTLAQVDVVVRALNRLPESAGLAVRQRAEQHLVEQAEHFDPSQLRILGRHVLEVVAPEVTDDEERRLLEAEERCARRHTRLTIRDRGDGTTELRGLVPEHVGARLRTYLDALASPRQPGPTSSLPAPRRLGEAFRALLERLPEQSLPQHGAHATTVMITIDLRDLTRGLGAGELASGGRLTAGEVRRLACNARIVPVVLGGRSEVLDLGRSSRLFTAAQRKALVIRDRHCRAERCTIPAAWCEAHHSGAPWAAGGRTDLADGVLLCAWHHHRAHEPDTRVGRLPNGDVRFSRRT